MKTKTNKLLPLEGPAVNPSAQRDQIIATFKVKKPPLTEYFTRQELADLLGRTTTTLDRWDLNGLGPPRIQLGRLVFYHRKTVAKWLREREGKHLSERR
jgi:hypothetical protein